MRVGIEQLRAELNKEIEQARAGILRWVVGLLAGQTVVILAGCSPSPGVSPGR